MKMPFIPHDLPPENIDWKSILPLVAKATASLARFDGLLSSLPNPMLMLSPLTTREAVLSSKIEGTQATLGEVLQYESGAKYDLEKTTDIREIQNYRVALKLAETSLETRSLSLSLLKELHAILMDSVRGQGKDPGLFRIDQNWIGSANCKMEEARFIPPNPLVMNDHLLLWQEFIESDYEPLLQLAIIHAQFEIIHPFKDGNGRLGRMLIPLFLFQKQVIAKSTFYLSEYLESHREEYYDRLLLISQKNDWQGWLEFFLNAIDKQATSNFQKAKNLIALYNDYKERFPQITHSQHAISMLDAFFNKPVISTTELIASTTINSRPSASNYLRQLSEAGLILCIREAAGQQPAVYALWELINEVEGYQVFTSAAHNYNTKDFV